MRFNGVDIHDIHRAISINKEIPPGMPRREIHTVRGNAREHLGGMTQERDEYIVRVNIAGKNADEAWSVREKLAAWAMSSRETTALLEPTHRKGVGYDAIVSSIAAPEFKKGFATVDVVFLLPDPVARDIAPMRASGSNEISMQIGGTAETRPILTITPAASVSNPTYSLDGKAFFALTGTIAAGTEIEIDFGEGRVRIGGTDSNDRINFKDSDWRPGFFPGAHKLTCPGSRIEARWHNRWQ